MATVCSTDWIDFMMLGTPGILLIEASSNRASTRTGVSTASRTVKTR